MTRGNEYRGPIQMGQKVYSGLYGGRFGIVYHIRGEQRPDSVRSLGGVVVTGGNAHVDVVFDCGTISRGIPESILKGVQWSISDEIATPQEIEEALLFAEAEKVKKEDAAAKKREYLAREKQELPSRYPYLQTKDGKTSPWALGARNLRVELAKAFPGVKFSVKSKSYTGGCSIDVYWADGPITKDVEKIAGKYEQGHFNAMEDLYEYGDSPFSDTFGGAKYVFCNRRYSVRLLALAAQKFGHEVEESDVTNYKGIKGLSIGEAQEIRRIAQDIALMPESTRKTKKATRVSQKKRQQSQGQDALTRMGLR
jgi:hypothetical protein